MATNPILIKLAKQAVVRQKAAFQPPMPAGDPSQGGGQPPPPTDPAMMQGDPSMGGAMPPTDPMSAAGGAPPDASGGQVLTADTVRQIMQETLTQMGIGGQGGMGGGAGGGMGGAGGAKGNKDALQQSLSMDVFQIKTMMSTLFNTMGIPLPDAVIQGPNRDRNSGLPLPPGTPGSTSDVAADQQQAPPTGGGGGAGGQKGAIPPIQPIQPATGGGGAGGGGGGGEKAGSQVIGRQEPRTTETRNKAAALSAMLRRKVK